jgi:addiction module HigA family antidote
VLAPLGLPVTQAAKALGLTRQALSNMPNGRTSLTAKMALRVEKAFGPKMERLMRVSSWK